MFPEFRPGTMIGLAFPEFGTCEGTEDWTEVGLTPAKLFPTTTL
jgi:hypothetical protein